jgi:hypothetical protein
VSYRSPLVLFGNSRGTAMRPLHLGFIPCQVTQVMPAQSRRRGYQSILVHGQQARCGLGSISVTGPNRATRLRGRKYLSGQLNVGACVQKGLRADNGMVLNRHRWKLQAHKTHALLPNISPGLPLFNHVWSISMIAHC